MFDFCLGKVKGKFSAAVLLARMHIETVFHNHTRTIHTRQRAKVKQTLVAQ